ncbi:MAG TPA: aminotransferase class I/II-fold pyridoxal phosphate-dependent enzyme [Opitutus sp.]|nr:aminotransferase class I/II-fold pyridoxal phosphate-dependent enzyme [Opitutus sp.]
MSEPAHRFATLCARAGTQRRDAAANAPVQPPIVQSAIFDLGGTDDAEAIFSGARKGYAYSRFGNPTVDALARTLAVFEGGADALVTSSGNAAVLCAITAAMHGRSGPLVTHHDIYGGSFELIRTLSSVYQLPVEFVDSTRTEQWLHAVSHAGAVLLETPSNPLMRLVDLAQTVEHARIAGAPVIVDNTVATPFNQRPFEFGADWIVHSTTKYLNGHADLIGGCVIRREPLSNVDRSIHKNLGGTVNATEAAMVLRGLRTFALRMEAHNRNGAALANWLAARPEVSRVYYPGLPAHPQAELVQRQMTRGAGGLLSFELAGGESAAVALFDRLKLIVHAVSLGGPETLVTRPARTSHRGMTPEARREAGVSDGLIRLSAGFEDINDLIADLEQAIARAT